MSLRRPAKNQPENGEIIGEHEGLMYYTYGQRQGLGVGGGFGRKEAPWYVSDKIIDENKLVVVQGQDHRSLYHTHVKASKVNWISGSPPDRDRKSVV